MLENTDAYISPEKEQYQVNETFNLHFTCIPDFSYYQKYAFGIFLEEYDEQEKKYKSTSNISCCDSETGEEIQGFDYEEKNTQDASKVSKIFFIKPTDQGKFFVRIFGSGYHYNDRGGSTATTYEKKFYFSVSK